MKGGHVAKSGKLSTIRRFSRGQKTFFGQGLLMGERLYLFFKLYSIHVYIAVAGNHATDRFRRRVVRLKVRFIPAFQVISKTVVVHRKEQYNLNNWPALLLGLWKIKNMGPHQQWFQPFAQTGFISRKLKNFLQSLIILNGDLWPFIFPTDKCKNKN